MEKVSLKEYAENINTVLNRRGHRLSKGYLYRLIRDDIKGKNKRVLWFKYILEGEKDHIFIKI